MGSVVPAVKDDEREGDERGHVAVHGHGGVHSIVLNRETRYEIEKRGEEKPV